ncbi:hypothetical protein J7E55_03035 [Bacillus sp. ISL-53]|uniref:hypothetical protein n=1 Tax=unclassified Bacillus (in: firmicutes) TaxID=185979 RepID=UPI001BE4FA6A|nr:MULTISPECIES: hypothetical protein [unclassified Bacillus (in: firmicutes)]MBT2602037.1 hypothetical protein [Bacillus sp. ISL-53]MBT2615502.1 hypothetical protein [Bacillus sp. ISL-78]MBT2632339.1 hypothetical protein [Bacillus sp. ISL-101]MBT2719012.1 hypothetical protein [Bacillus sp. ISL-57]
MADAEELAETIKRRLEDMVRQLDRLDEELKGNFDKVNYRIDQSVMEITTRLNKIKSTLEKGNHKN